MEPTRRVRDVLQLSEPTISTTPMVNPSRQGHEAPRHGKRGELGGGGAPAKEQRL